MAHVLVTGATGYIGGRLVPELLEAGHYVRCLARTPSKLDGRPWRDAVDVVEGDVTDAASLAGAFDGVDVAYFLVHSMGGKDAFAAEDRQAAETFRGAATKADVHRIIYLGGLGRDDDPDLSPHLESRHEVGQVLADGSVAVTELRAAIILGSGSASFEMLRYLVEVLPAMTTPKWVENRCQPIAIRDIVSWLVGSIDPGHEQDQIVEVGGPDVLTYREMMQGYARAAGLRRRLIIGVPVLSPHLSSLWVGLVTPLPSALARPLVESLVNEVIVRHPSTPPFDRPLLGFATAVERALRNSGPAQVATSWSESSHDHAADPQPSDPHWGGGSLLVDHHDLVSNAAPEDLFATAATVGGEGGWFGTDAVWRLRGAFDRLVGGVGPRVGRDDSMKLKVGDQVDAWRVDVVEPDSLIRLRSETRLPGEAWLEWRIEPVDGGRSRLIQRLVFYPRGLLGRAYWYGLWPIDRVVLGRLAAGVVRDAERGALGTGGRHVVAPAPDGIAL